MRRGLAALIAALAAILLLPPAEAQEAYIALGAGDGGRVFLAGPVALAEEGRFRTSVGAVVTAWAEADERWAFDRWVSDETMINNSRSNPLVFRVNGSMRLTALFRPLYERVEFVSIRVDSPVPISYPDVVLRGRRVTISAPEAASYGGRSDMRYVFVGWILPDGNASASSTVSLIADRDVSLKALYRVEFQFLGEWFRIEDGVLLPQGEVELGPGVRGLVSCYRYARLNMTLCPGGRELYVPADVYPELEPLYERRVRLAITVLGPAEPVTLLVNGEPLLAEPGSPLERWVAENSTVTVEAEGRVGDYLLEGDRVMVLSATRPLNIVVTYSLDPLSRFHPLLRPMGSVILSTPLSGALQELPDPAPNLVASAPLGAAAGLAALAAARLRRWAGRRGAPTTVAPGPAVETESPRQVGYTRALSRTIAIDDGLDPELRELVLQRVSSAGGQEGQVRRVAGARRVGVKRLLEMLAEGSLGEPVAVPYAELVGAIASGALTGEALALLRARGVVVDGGPEPLPLELPAGTPAAILGGDGKAYSLSSAGARVVRHWSLRPDELPGLLPREKKAREGFRVALSWCDLLEPQEVLEYVGVAASSGVPLIMLFDEDSVELPPNTSALRLAPPEDRLLAATAIAESVLAGSNLDPRGAEYAARLASRLPGLQFAFARAVGASPRNPLSSLPRYAKKLGSAAYAAADAVRLGWSREELGSRVADTLRAYGEVRLLKYHGRIMDKLTRLLEVAEEWSSSRS